MIRLFFTCSIVFLFFTLNAQSIKLNYEPEGVVIKFNFDSLTIYTDTTSIFEVYNENGKLKAYDARVINFVRKEVGKTQSDTVCFSGNFIPFNDTIQQKYQSDWYIEWLIIHLTKQNKLKMYDKQGVRVKHVKRKKIGTKQEGYIRRAYINKQTGVELFSEILYFVTGTPSF